MLIVLAHLPGFTLVGVGVSVGLLVRLLLNDLPVTLKKLGLRDSVIVWKPLACPVVFPFFNELYRAHVLIALFEEARLLESQGAREQ